MDLVWTIYSHTLIIYRRYIDDDFNKIYLNVFPNFPRRATIKICHCSKSTATCRSLVLVEEDTTKIDAKTLRPPDRQTIPIAARQKALPLLLHRVYQYQVARAQKLHNEDTIAAQGLPYHAHGPVHKPPLLVKVAGEADKDTRPGHNAKV